MERQLCDFEGDIEIEVRNGIRIFLREPILLDEDVTWIVGAPPTERRAAGNDLIMVYLAEKQSPLTDPRYTIPVELRFVQVRGRYRLKQGFLGRNLSEILTPELILQCMKLVCRSEKSILDRKLTVDFSELDPGIFPDREQVIDLFGEPHFTNGDLTVIRYDYVQKTDSPEKAHARVDLIFDRIGNMRRVDLRYSRYRLTADIPDRKAYLVVSGL